MTAALFALCIISNITWYLFTIYLLERVEEQINGTE